MHVLIVAEALPHMQLFARSQLRLGNTLGVYTSTPRFKLRSFPKEIDYHFVPGPVQLLRGALRNRVVMPKAWNDWDSDFFDKLTARLIGDGAMMLGASTSSLYTGRAMQKRGGKYVVDRACPDIRVQEREMVEEARKVGSTFQCAPQWFLDRQIAEYEEADFIVSPSDYSRNSFPEHLRAKTVLLRLTGSVRTTYKTPSTEPRPFTVGVVGGQPLRKGYYYLLQAWKQLGWKDARLQLRTTAEQMGKYPVLAKLVADQPTVSYVPYLPDISDFYAGCDAFILPSIDDGFGMALFEALNQGVPCIATTHCGASELLTPEQDFIRIDPFRTDQIKDALERLRGDADLRARLGANGRARVGELQDDLGGASFHRGVEELMARAFPSS